MIEAFHSELTLLQGYPVSSLCVERDQLSHLLSACPGRTSPAVMQPPPGMPLPSADIAPPPYEPPGHPMPQPGFVTPHMNADGAYMPAGELGRDLKETSSFHPELTVARHQSCHVK